MSQTIVVDRIAGSLNTDTGEVTVVEKAPITMGAGREFSRDEMLDAFNPVANKEHWKYPVDAVVDADQRDVLDQAIPYFTGSCAHFTEVEGGKLRVQADGYFNAIGA